jgi:hypothetical protein
MIKATSNKIVGDGTDWRIFGELKHELEELIASLGGSEACSGNMLRSGLQGIGGG